MRLSELHAMGFDESVKSGRYIDLKCSCCRPVAVNGYPLHERGCPNDRHECNGCNALTPVNQRYCEDCAL